MVTEVADELNPQALSALRALQEFCEKKQRTKLLFPDQGASVFLVAKYKKIPLFVKNLRRIPVSLPCPDRTQENTSICLILPDMDLSKKALRDSDVDKQAREWAELLREKYGLTSNNYAKIFTFKQMEREYSQYADRAKLANAYDLFMVDRSLMKKAFNFMGRHFQKATKMPLPISADRDFSAQLKKAYSNTTMVFAPLKQDTVTIRLGNLEQTIDQLESNLLVVVQTLLEHFPGGPMNIRSCHIQSMQISLPVYVDFGSSNNVNLEVLQNQHAYRTEIGDCSTLPDGLNVKVRADGKITIVDAESMKALEDVDLDELMTVGPLKKKAKKGQ